MGKSFEIIQHQVLDAYKRVKANQGAEGVDGIENLMLVLFQHWQAGVRPTIATAGAV